MSFITNLRTKILESRALPGLFYGIGLREQLIDSFGLNKYSERFTPAKVAVLTANFAIRYSSVGSMPYTTFPALDNVLSYTGLPVAVVAGKYVNIGLGVMSGAYAIGQFTKAFFQKDEKSLDNAKKASIKTIGHFAAYSLDSYFIKTDMHLLRYLTKGISFTYAFSGLATDFFGVTRKIHDAILPYFSNMSLEDKIKRIQSEKDQLGKDLNQKKIEIEAIKKEKETSVNELDRLRLNQPARDIDINRIGNLNKQIKELEKDLKDSNKKIRELENKNKLLEAQLAAALDQARKEGSLVEERTKRAVDDAKLKQGAAQEKAEKALKKAEEERKRAVAAQRDANEARKKEAEAQRGAQIAQEERRKLLEAEAARKRLILREQENLGISEPIATRKGPRHSLGSP